MFELKTRMTIRSVKISAKDKEGRVLRKCRLTLQAPLDDEIADALGDDAKKAKKSLERFGLVSAVMATDQIVVSAKLTSDEGKSVEVKELSGTKATLRVGNEEGDDEESEGKPPTVALEFEFPWTADAWGFLGKNCSSQVDVDLSPVQKTLSGTEKPKASDKRAAAEATNGHGDAKPEKKRRSKKADAELVAGEAAPLKTGAESHADAWT